MTSPNLDRYRTSDGTLLPEWQWRQIDESITEAGGQWRTGTDLIKDVHLDTDGVQGGQVYVRDNQGNISGYGGPGGGDAAGLFSTFDANTNGAYTRQWGDYTSGAGQSGYGGTGASGGARGTGGGSGAAAAGKDAYARLQAVLRDYGLESLAGQVQQWLTEGLSESEIPQRMRDTQEFKTRFPAIEERKKKGLAPISPGEYVAYERSARQMMRAAGLPEGFYDAPDDFQRFLNNDLSLSELGDRVTLAANAAFKMPQEDRDALQAWGMGPGDLTAFWLDPDKAQPLLERKYAAAQLAGAGSRSGWGSLGESKATELAGLGVTAQEATQGFGDLVQSKELFQSLDRTEDAIGADEQLDARFAGNANAQRRIEQRRRKRQSTFQGGGSFAASQGGLTGLGAAD